jgi:hypothetical protein
MALPDSLLVVEATSIVFADATDWPAGGSYSWGDDDHQLDLTSLAADGYRQTAKGDLGANRYYSYAVDLAVEMAADPTADEVWTVWVGYSKSGTVGTDNPGGLSGSDAAYSGYSGGTAANGIKNLRRVGQLVLDTINDLDAPQIQEVGLIFPTARYLMFVLHNGSSVAHHSDAVQAALRLRPQGLQIQD